jgi:hypothetical protein
MPDKINVNQVIIEASIVFISIFTTLSLLFGAISSDFKSVYSYLGYMLYYSLPFILACFFGIISSIIEQSDLKFTKLLVEIEVAFFLTGLMMVIFLATSAAESVLLPLVYVISVPFFGLVFLEFFIFSVFLMGLAVRVDDREVNKTKNKRVTGITDFIIKKRNALVGERALKFFKRKKTKAAVTVALSIVLIFSFIGGIVSMSMFGYMPTSSKAASGTMPLQSNVPFNLTLCQTANASLEIADSVKL